MMVVAMVIASCGGHYRLCFWQSLWRFLLEEVYIVIADYMIFLSTASSNLFLYLSMEIYCKLSCVQCNFTVLQDPSSICNCHFEPYTHLMGSLLLEHLKVRIKLIQQQLNPPPDWKTKSECFNTAQCYDDARLHI